MEGKAECNTSCTVQVSILVPDEYKSDFEEYVADNFTSLDEDTEIDNLYLYNDKFEIDINAKSRVFLDIISEEDEEYKIEDIIYGRAFVFESETKQLYDDIKDMFNDRLIPNFKAQHHITEDIEITDITMTDLRENEFCDIEIENYEPDLYDDYRDSYL